MYSGRDFVWLYERCDQIAFLDGHVRAFEWFGSAPRRCVYDNLTAAVRRIALPQRELTRSFQALTSHYTFEPCFARVGVGHDKGGVEARGKGIRLQHLVPIPAGKRLREISEGLLASVAQQAATEADREGLTALAKFECERPLMLELATVPFDARRVQPVVVRSSARVKIEGTWYPVPSGWARLDATAYVGPEEVEIRCRGESVTHARQRFGARVVAHRLHLRELAKKPQAVRQVAGELVEELGGPFGSLWRMLSETYGEKDGARVLARVLGAITDHGEEAVKAALERALANQRMDLLSLGANDPEPLQSRIAIPDSLLGIDVEMASAADYDVLLVGGAS
jgi:hypothetical protein